MFLISEGVISQILGFKYVKDSLSFISLARAFNFLLAFLQRFSTYLTFVFKIFLIEQLLIVTSAIWMFVSPYHDSLHSVVSKPYK